MPSNYAHYRFGVELIEKLSPDVRRTVGRFRQLFDMGLHGPDLFLYHDPLVKTASVKLSKKFHSQSGKIFFERVCRSLQLNPSEGAMAYLYGVLAHYTLDSMSHPYVRRMVEQGTDTHNQIETEFDRYLLELDGKTPAYLYDQSGHMQLTPGECETVASFYPGASAGTIRRSVKRMAACTRFLVMPKGPRRTIVERSLKLTAPGAAGLVMQTRPDHSSKQRNEAMLRLYEMALDRYMVLLDQIHTHLRCKTPLGTDFSLTFD